MSDRLRVEQQWALSSGLRIAAFLFGLNALSCLIILEKIVGFATSKLTAMLIIGIPLALVHAAAIGCETRDINSINAMPTQQQRYLKIRSLVYTAVTLVVLIIVVLVCI